MNTRPGKPFRVLGFVVLFLLAQAPSVVAADVTLAWDRNTESTVTGYKVYYGAASRTYGAPINAGNNTTCTVPGLGPGTYYLAVTAYDGSGNESGYSNEVTTTISCSYTISPTSQAYSWNSVSDSVSVTAPIGCTWTAVSNASWLTITSGTAGSGSGTVNYSVTSNDTTSPRIGTLTIAGQTFTVTQSVPSCTYSISPTGQSFSDSGGSGSVSVTASSGCAWTAVSGATWINITSGGSGTGSGTVNYAVLANNSTSSRSGTMTIAGQTFTVTQPGLNCTFSVSPLGFAVSSTGGTVSATVAVSEACAWTATSNTGWITLASSAGGSRTGNGTAGFVVAENKSKNSRTGTVTVAGQTITVMEAGTSCSFAVSPTSAFFTDTGGTGTVTVAGNGNCKWIASSNTSWIAITSGTSGSGNGTVTYSVQANVNTITRTGTMTIAGKTIAVTQSGAGCNFSISPSSQSFDGNGGTGSVAVSGSGTCGWSASSNAGWITITSGKSGSGNGTLNFTVAANTTSKSRSGSLFIAGQTFTVTQAGKNIVYFSQVASGEDWVSAIVLTNPSSTETVTGTISLFDDRGEPIVASFNNQPPANSVSFSINPLGIATFTTDGTDGLFSGSAQVRGNLPLSGVVEFTHPALGTTGVGESALFRSLMTPVVRDSSQELNTGIALSNTLTREVELKLSLRGTNGREVEGGQASQTVPAGGHLAKFIDQLFPNADTSNFQGTLVVTSAVEEEGVAATAIQIGSSTGEFTTLPVVSVDPAPSTTELYFAQFANGSGWKTSLFLTNPTASTSNSELRFFDDEGNPLEISVNGQTSVSVPSSLQPMGGAVIPTDGSGSLVSGSARVIADEAIGGVLRFSLPSLGMAGVGSTEAMQSFISPVVRSTDENWSTGIAVASIGSPVTLRLTLRNENGEPVSGGQATLGLRANGHVARFIEQLFPDADTRDFRGTVTVEAEGGRIVGTALQIGSKAGQFTTLPVTELRY